MCNVIMADTVADLDHQQPTNITSQQWSGVEFHSLFDQEGSLECETAATPCLFHTDPCPVAYLPYWASGHVHTSNRSKSTGTLPSKTNLRTVAKPNYQSSSRQVLTEKKECHNDRHAKITNTDDTRKLAPKNLSSRDTQRTTPAT